MHVVALRVGRASIGVSKSAGTARFLAGRRDGGDNRLLLFFALSVACLAALGEDNLGIVPCPWGLLLLSVRGDEVDFKHRCSSPVMVARCANANRLLRPPPLSPLLLPSVLPVMMISYC